MRDRGGVQGQRRVAAEGEYSARHNSGGDDEYHNGGKYPTLARDRIADPVNPRFLGSEKHFGEETEQADGVHRRR